MSSYIGSDPFLLTLVKMNLLLAKPHSDAWIDQDLNIVNKYSLQWVVLSLLAPFYRLFCCGDVYSHVRVDKVAHALLQLCQNHRSDLEDRPELIDLIKTRILEPLDAKTKGKYKEALRFVVQRLDALVPNPPDYVSCLHVLPDTIDWEVSPNVKNQLMDVLQSMLPMAKERASRLTFIKTGPPGLRSRELILMKAPLCWFSESEPVQEVLRRPLPLSLRIVYTKTHQVADIIFLSKKKMGVGGQTTVRLCFSFFSGQTTVRKKIADIVHRRVVEQLIAHPPDRGLVPPLAVWENGSKIQATEPLRSHTLIDGLVIQRISVAEKKSLCVDLLTGLSTLHQIQHPGLFYENEILSQAGFSSFVSFPRLPLLQRCATGPFRIAHCDLKPANILLTRINGQLRAEITDFGGVNPFDWPISLGFRSPEKIKADRITSEDLFRFYQRFGQPTDIWAMGLVFALILIGRDSRPIPHYSPLRCMNEPFHQSFVAHSRHFIGRFFPVHKITLETPFGRLMQRDVDNSIQELVQESILSCPTSDQPLLRNLWALVRRMLQVDPDVRISAQQALEFLA